MNAAPAPPAPARPDVGAEAATLRSHRFRAAREADWRRLEALLMKIERGGPRALSFDEARDLAALYRGAAYALSVAREISLDRALLIYLEALVARAVTAVYAPVESPAAAARRFFTRSGPGAFRAALWPLLLSLAVFLGAALSGAALFHLDPAWYEALMPDEARGLAASREDLLSYIYGAEAGEAAAAGELTAFTAYLFANNAGVALLCFGFGVFAGIGVAMVLAFNGLLIGLFVALHVDRGLGYDIGGWLSIHGVTELSAIVIAGGAGFTLARGVLFPGRARRADALRAEGRVAVKLVLVSVALLALAALLEGYGRQWVQDAETRYAVGFGAALAWTAWLTLGGRRR